MSQGQGAILQQDFSAGVFHDTADYLIPQNGLDELIDAYLEEDGAAVERGGTAYLSNAAFGTSLRWVWDGYFDAGQRTVFASSSDFAVLASDGETPVDLGSDGLTLPKPAAQVAGMLFIPGGYIYAGSRESADYTTSGSNTTVTTGSNTVSDPSGGFTANVDPGMLMQRGSERLYVVDAVNSDTSLTLRDELDEDGVTIGYEGTTSSAIDVTFYRLYKIVDADPYPDADFYAVLANRLLWAVENIVHYSEILRPHDHTATIGASSIPNTQELPEGERVTGIQSIGNLALIFTTRGVWTLHGLPFEIVDTSGGPQHRLERHSGQHILWSGAGIAAWEQFLVVPCVDGVWMLDGISQPRRVSHPIDDHLMNYVNRGYTTGQAVVHRGHYFLPVCTAAATMRDLLVSRINRPITIEGRTVHPWSHFAHHAESLIAFTIQVGETVREPVLVGASVGTDAKLVTCPFFEPTAASKLDADDQVPTLDLITRAFATSSDTLNSVRNVRTRYELADADADDPELEFSYSLGGQLPGLPTYNGGYLYNDGVEYVSDDAGRGFITIACTGPESNGRTPKRCRINQTTRFFKWRIRNPLPSAGCRIRSIDIRIRPSEAVRR